MLEEERKIVSEVLEVIEKGRKLRLNFKKIQESEIQKKLGWGSGKVELEWGLGKVELG